MYISIKKINCVGRQSMRAIFVAVSMASITACGGGGNGSAATTPPAPLSNLFVADGFNFAIASVVNANPSPGLVTLDRVIAGPNTGVFNNVRDFAIDAGADRLYVANGTFILVFNNAGTANGDVAPARTITSSFINDADSLFLDTASNTLYVGDSLNNIWAIHNASTANGSIVPNRAIHEASVGTTITRDIFVDTTRDLLYVSRVTFTPSANHILVFNNASTADGTNLTPNRTITFGPPSMNSGSIFVDVTNDRLYAANTSNNTVRVLDNVSTANGSVTENRTINLSISPTELTLDTRNNRLYVLGSDTLQIINGADTANGPVLATEVRASSGNSSLSAVAVRP